MIYYGKSSHTKQKVMCKVWEKSGTSFQSPLLVSQNSIYLIPPGMICNKMGEMLLAIEAH